MKTLLPFLFCLFTLNNFAQQIANVRTAQEGKQVVVTYDLTGGNSRLAFRFRLIPDYSNSYTGFRLAQDL